VGAALTGAFLAIGFLAAGAFLATGLAAGFLAGMAMSPSYEIGRGTVKGSSDRKIGIEITKYSLITVSADVFRVLPSSRRERARY
jgi:hypothetical protein